MTRAAPWLDRFRRVTSSGAFIAEIDGLRFVAIASVVLFHLAVDLSIKSPARYARADGWAAQLAWNGFRGVELFFVISGFILALPFAAHFLRGAPKVRLRAYLLRRVTRLDPPYVACMLLLFAAHLARGRTALELGPHLGASLVYLHNLIFSAESAINNVAWSLEIEIQFYLLAPFLSLLFAIPSRTLRRSLMAALCAVCAALSWRYIEPGGRAYLSILRFLQFFLAGLLLADVFVTDWQSRPAQGRTWDAVSLAGWPLLFVLWSTMALPTAGGAPARGSLAGALLFPAMVFLLYCAAFRGEVTSRFFRNPWVSTIGGMCYTIYLFHNPLLGMAIRATGAIAPFASYAANLGLQLLMTTPAVLLPSAVYFMLVEKPCMRRDWPQRLYAHLASLPALRGA